MIYKDIPQGTPEWFALRCGHVTASNVSDCSAKGRDGKSEGVTRKKYRTRIITEWLTGKPMESGFKSDAMEHGNEMEAEARASYEAHALELVDQITFATHDTIENFGASPDGLVGSEGLVEIKCPMSHTHYAYLSDGKVPAEYKDQMIAQCAVLKRKWVDFISFDNRFPPHMQLFVVRFEPTEKEIADMENAVTEFLKECWTEYAKWVQK
jgi:hypothetical protein